MELHVPAKENDAKVFSGSIDPGKYLCVILCSGCLGVTPGVFLNNGKIGGSWVPSGFLSNIPHIIP